MAHLWGLFEQAVQRFGVREKERERERERESERERDGEIDREFHGERESERAKTFFSCPPKSINLRNFKII